MNEKDFVDKVEDFLKNAGFKVEREVIPDEFKDRKMPLRVDMIIYRKDVGKIGIEAKQMNSLRKGGAIAKAFEQTKKYIRFEYEGESIQKWALMVYTNKYESTSIGRFFSEVTYFIQGWLNFYGISWIEVEFSKGGEIERIIFDRNQKNSLYITK